MQKKTRVFYFVPIIIIPFFDKDTVVAMLKAAFGG